VAKTIDFESLLASFSSDTFKRFRYPQRVVLNSYASEFVDKSDVGLELPTGAGKSLIALLVAEAWRRDGKSACVLTANDALASELEREAKKLGVETAPLAGPRDQISTLDTRRIARKRALGVMNYWIYFNQNPVVEPTDLVILDDVHLADGALRSLFSASVTKYEHPQLFERLVALLSEALPGYPSLRYAAEGGDDPRSPTDLIAPHDHERVIASVADMLNAADKPTDLDFRWGRLRPRAADVHMYVSSDEICLRPYIWPLQEHRHYEASTQRLYMSATLGTGSDLARRLGSAPVALIPIPSDAAQPLGRRLIVVDGKRKTPLANAAIKAAVEAKGKALWLTRSGPKADSLAERLRKAGTAPVYRLSREGSEVQQFASEKRGHLVAAGRYDGIDLPGKVCRAVCVTELPASIDLQETFIAEQLRDADFLVERLNARILQSLGRANRSKADYAVYVLADSRFAEHFRRERNRRSFPPGINAELDVAEELADGTVEDLSSLVRDFVAGRFQVFDQLVAAELKYHEDARVPASEDPVSGDLEVAGWRKMYVQDYPSAQKIFGQWATTCQAAGRREQAAFAMVCEARAALALGRSGDAAAQATARDLVLRAVDTGGARSTWFNGLRTSVASGPTDRGLGSLEEVADAILQAFDSEAVRTGGHKPRFERQRVAVSKKLGHGGHFEFQEGLEVLGQLLGVHAVRPKKGTGATDCRWDWAEQGRRQMLVWEAKIDHSPHGALTVSDVDQANGQLRVARDEYEPRGVSCRAALVSHLLPDTAAAGRIAPVVLVEKSAIVALWERLAALYARYLEAWHPDDAVARRQAVERVADSLPPDRWLTTALDAGAHVGRAQLLAEWGE
jgi:hypothetical protein